MSTTLQAQILPVVQSKLFNLPLEYLY